MQKVSNKYIYNFGLRCAASGQQPKADLELMLAEEHILKKSSAYLKDLRLTRNVRPLEACTWFVAASDISSVPLQSIDFDTNTALELD